MRVRPGQRRRLKDATQPRTTWLAVTLLVVLCCNAAPVRAINWGRAFSEFGQSVGEAVQGAADPRLWDIADAGHPDRAVTNIDQLPAAARQSSGQQGDKPQDQLASSTGTWDATSAKSAAAADALNEAFGLAQQLIEQAHAAVQGMGMPAGTKASFTKALDSFLQAETHLRDWGLSVLKPSLAPRATAEASKSPEQLQHQSISALRTVVQELNSMVPADAAKSTGASCSGITGKSAPAGNEQGPVADIVRCLVCLEQLTTDMTAAAADISGENVKATDKDTRKGHSLLYPLSSSAEQLWHGILKGTRRLYNLAASAGRTSADHASDTAAHLQHTSERTAQAVTETAHEAADTAEHAAAAAKEKAQQAGHTVQHAASKAADAAQQGAEAVEGAAKHTAHKAAGAVKHAAHTAGHTAHNAGEQVQHAAHATGGAVKHGAEVVGDAAAGAAAAGFDKTGDALDAGADALHTAADAAHEKADDLTAKKHHHKAAESQQRDKSSEAVMNATNEPEVELPPTDVPHSFASMVTSIIQPGADKAADSVQDAAHAVAGGVRQAASNITESAQGAAHKAKEYIKDAARDAAGGPVKAAEQLAGQAGKEQESLLQKLNHQPVRVLESAKDIAHRATGKAKGAVDDAAIAADTSLRSAADKADEAVDKVQDTAETAAGRVKDAMSDAAEQARAAGSAVQDKAKETADTAKRHTKETAEHARAAGTKVQREVQEDAEKAADSAAGVLGSVQQAAQAAAEAMKQHVVEPVQQHVIEPVKDWAAEVRAQQEQVQLATEQPTTASAAARKEAQQQGHDGVDSTLQDLSETAKHAAQSVADEVTAAGADVADLASGAAKDVPKHAAGAWSSIKRWFRRSAREAETAADRLEGTTQQAVEAARGAGEQLEDKAVHVDAGVLHPQQEEPLAPARQKLAAAWAGAKYDAEGEWNNTEVLRFGAPQTAGDAMADLYHSTARGLMHAGSAFSHMVVAPIRVLPGAKHLLFKPTPQRSAVNATLERIKDAAASVTAGAPSVDSLIDAAQQYLPGQQLGRGHPGASTPAPVKSAVGSVKHAAQKVTDKLAGTASAAQDTAEAALKPAVSEATDAVKKGTEQLVSVGEAFTSDLKSAQKQKEQQQRLCDYEHQLKQLRGDVPEALYHKLAVVQALNQHSSNLLDEVLSSMQDVLHVEKPTELSASEAAAELERQARNGKKRNALFGGIIGTLRRVRHGITGGAVGLLDVAKVVPNAATTAVHDAQHAAKTAGQQLQQAGQATAGFLADNLEQRVDAAKSAHKAVTHGVKSVAEDVNDALANAAATAAGTTQNAIDAAAAARDAAGKGVKDATEFFAENLEQRKDAAAAAARAAKQGVQGVVHDTQKAAVGTARAVEHAASRVAGGVKDTAEGIAEGAACAFGTVKDAAGNVVCAVKDTTVGAATAVKDTAVGAATAVKDTAAGAAHAVQHTAAATGHAVQHAAASTVGAAVQMTAGATAAVFDKTGDVLDAGADALHTAADAAHSTADKITDAAQLHQPQQQLADSQETGRDSSHVGHVHVGLPVAGVSVDKNAIAADADARNAAAVQHARDKIKSAAHDVAGAARSSLQDVADTTADAAHATKHAARRAGDKMKHAVDATAQAVADTAAGTAHGAQHAVGHAVHKAEDTAAAAAHAAGKAAHDAAAGMQHAAHSVEQGISTTAHAAKDTAQHAAHETGAAVKHAAHTVGHTAHKAGEQVQHAAHATGGAVKHGAEVAGDAAAGAAAAGLDKTGDALDAGADALHTAADAAHGTADKVEDSRHGHGNWHAAVM